MCLHLSLYAKCGRNWEAYESAMSFLSPHFVIVYFELENSKKNIHPHSRLATLMAHVGEKNESVSITNISRLPLDRVQLMIKTGFNIYSEAHLGTKRGNK